LFRYAWDNKELKLKNGNSFEYCSGFFVELKKKYNIPDPIHVEDIIKNNNYWGNDIIGRLFCYIYKINIKLIKVKDTVSEHTWHGGEEPIDLEDDTAQQRPPNKTAFILCQEDIHFQVLHCD